MTARRSGSLRFRLLAASAVSIAAALTVAGFVFVRLFEAHSERRIVDELRVNLDQIVARIERDPEGRLILASPLADPRFGQFQSGLYWQVVAPDQTLRSRSLWDQTIALPADPLTDGGIHQHRIAGPGVGELLVLERAIELPERLGGQTVRAAVAVDARDLAAATRAFARDLLPYLLFLGVLLTMAAAAQVFVGLRPLSVLRARLAAVRSDSGRRLEGNFPQEVEPLVSELNALLDARERQVEKARARAADLAHGLRTPLQVLAGDVARLRSRGENAEADEIEAVVSGMNRHVERELVRARSASAGGTASAAVAPVVDQVLRVVRRTPSGSRIGWTVDIPAELKARIHPDDLAEAIGNLVENAARHAAATVAVTAARKADRVVIAIEDDGPGIPADQTDLVLARGGRLDQSGPGAGLGLAIVGEIAEAWGGGLILGNAEPGLRVEIELPAAA